MRGKEIINKPIITADEGEQIYYADDIIFDPLKGRVLAVLAEFGSLLIKTKIVPFREVKSIGPDAITVRSRESVMTADEDPEVAKYLAEDRRIRGKQVITESGEDLGEIADVVFDETTGRVTGYQVTGGVFADAYKGRPFLPVPQINRIGEDVVFVPDKVGEMMAQQLGGVKRVAQDVSSKVKSEAGELTGQARGRYQKYTERQPGERVREETGRFWDSVRKSASRLTGRAADEIENQRIKNALGRPVSRVIFDQQDQIILNTGDLVTHSAINRAREEGVLDQILDSIQVTKPEFSKEELRADQDRRRR